MRCHDLANELLDYAGAGDRSGYKSARDRMRQEEPVNAREAEEWARIQISAWRDCRFFAWRADHLRRETDG